MKKYFFFLFVSLFIVTISFALEVDKSELQSASENQTIEFINYTGPHSVINSISQIKGIGSSMGSQVSKNPALATNLGSKNKYYVVHAVDESKGKFDADILFIGSDATVDHIDNLRRIISGYLSSAYGYSEKDADTLAVFITVYNAVYRGKLEAFQSKYKDIVVKNLTAENCGLSVNYSDWPGKSQIVIPLYDVANGGLSTVDTSVISDTKVVESMQEDDDKNVESRKDMVDLKERESDAASQAAKESQKAAVEEEKKAEEANKKAEEAKKEADQAQKEADQAQQVADEKQKIADENPQDKEAQEEAKEAQEEADQAQQVADEKKAEAESEQENAYEAQKTADEKKEEASEKQALADKKQSEAQSERKEIAQDQNEVQKKEAAQAKMTAEYGLVITDQSNMYSRLVKFSAETGEIMKNSPVTVIRNRTIFKTSQGYLAIAGEEGENKAIKLVTLDTENMEIAAESQLDIAADSVLVQNGSDFYCVISKDGSFYVAKFDESLNAKIVSDVAVLSCSPISVMSSGIVVTDSNGRLTILNADDLTAINK
ncbi:MAG: hypothetical protein K5866_01185 [Treponema sp.]|nr:hypothetical protein [Treponema sp.]